MVEETRTFSLQGTADSVNKSQVTTDETIFLIDSILLNPNSSQSLYVGDGRKEFPIPAGSTISLTNTKLSTVFVRASSGTQDFYVIGNAITQYPIIKGGAL